MWKVRKKAEVITDCKLSTVHTVVSKNLYISLTANNKDVLSSQR